MDPNPIKNSAVLLAHARDSILPALSKSGFQISGRNHPLEPLREHLWIDWERGAELISLRWDRHKATLTLDLINETGEVQNIAYTCTDGARSTDDLMQRLSQFVEQVKGARLLAPNLSDA
jgi:hypothetical protein